MLKHIKHQKTYLQLPTYIPEYHGLRTPNEDINQKYLENWADVADKI